MEHGNITFTVQQMVRLGSKQEPKYQVEGMYLKNPKPLGPYHRNMCNCEVSDARRPIA
jgi:hypothetical protein